MIRKQFNPQNLPVQKCEFGESLTVQNDVPTLVEILSRYAQTGEIIGTVRPSFSDENIVQDNDIIQPDIEDLNISYQNLYNEKEIEGVSTKSFLDQKSLSDKDQQLKNVQDGTPHEEGSQETVE